MIKRCLFGLSLLMLCATAADAGDLYVAKTGSSDANDCSISSKCLTVNRACSLAPEGQTTVNVAPGTYDYDKCHIKHFRFVQVIGTGSDRTTVVVRAETDAVFDAQNHSTLTINNLTIGTTPGGAGVIGIRSRQHVTVDHNNVDFAAMVIGMAPGENSRINCLGAPRITGDQYYHIAVSGNATTVNARCVTEMVGQPTIYSYFWIAEEAVVLANGGAITGPWGNVTYKYIVDNGKLYRPGTDGNIPGSSTIVQRDGKVY